LLFWHADVSTHLKHYAIEGYDAKARHEYIGSVHAVEAVDTKNTILKCKNFCFFLGIACC
jgi:hypothetical protein